MGTCTGRTGVSGVQVYGRNDEDRHTRTWTVTGKDPDKGLDILPLRYHLGTLVTVLMIDFYTYFSRNRPFTGYSA